MAINFMKIQKGIVFTPQASAPASPEDGNLYYDSGLGQFRFRQSAAWVALPNAFLSDPMTTIGDIIIRNASNVTARLPVGSNNQVLTVVSGVPAWQNATGGGSGSGGSGGQDTDLELLTADEYDIRLSTASNEITDDFGDEDKGTKTNMLQANSALRFSGSNLTGSYERVRQTTPKMGTISGIAVYTGQHLAPKATAVTSTTIIFEGDVTNMFANGKKILFAKKTTSDGITVHEFLRETTNKVATSVTVNGTPTYNSGTNETTLTVTNPNTLDLDFDLTTGQYAASLRVIPFDYKYEVKSLAASGYEEMLLDEVHGLQTVRLLGEAFYRELTSGITGSILKFDSAMSPNQQYGIIRVLENANTSDKWHWFHTEDAGRTWTHFSTTKDYGATNGSEETGGSWQYQNSQQIVVGDNGKWFCAYQKYDGTRSWIQGVYGDLSGTPSINDTIDNTGTGLGNTFGTGIIYKDSATDFNCPGVAASDNLDFVVVFCNNSPSTLMYFAKYLTGGSSLGTSVGYTGNGGNASTFPVRIFVSGNNPNCKIHVLWKKGGTLETYYFRFNQTSLTATDSFALLGGSLMAHASMDTARDRITVMCTPVAYNSASIYDITTVHSGTPTASAAKTMFPATYESSLDPFKGTDTSAPEHFFKTHHKSIFFNPTDSKHQFHVLDWTRTDGIRRTTIAEIRDITSYQGAHVNMYGWADSVLFRDTTGTALRGQTITTNGNAIRSFGAILYQVGTIIPGSSLVCKVYATSGGTPTGSALYASVNSIDPANLTNVATNGQWVYFNFDNLALLNTPLNPGAATMYAFV